VQNLQCAGGREAAGDGAVDCVAPTFTQLAGGRALRQKNRRARKKNLKIEVGRIPRKLFVSQKSFIGNIVVVLVFLLVRNPRHFSSLSSVALQVDS
jgi:hypothetical protein